jgi:hypothetical protein
MTDQTNLLDFFAYLDDGDELKKEQRDELVALTEGTPEGALIAAADIVTLGGEVILDARYGHCSRAKTWAGKGRPGSYTFAPVRSGYACVSPSGEKPELWTQSSSDGFHREERTRWEVRKISLGGVELSLARQVG